jgi:hypothetical protein
MMYLRPGAGSGSFGSLKFVKPSPPNLVPRSENKAVFVLIGSVCPSQNAQ